MKRIFFITLFGFVFSAILFISPSDVFAQASTIVDISFPGVTNTGGGIQGYVSRMYQFALYIAGFLALAMITWGAIVYTTSAGRPDRQNEGKDIIISALWGVVLLFGSYLILNTINPGLTRLGEGFLSTSTKSGLSVQCPQPGPGYIYIAEPSSTSTSGYVCRQVPKPAECTAEVLRLCTSKITNVNGKIVASFSLQPPLQASQPIFPRPTGIPNCSQFSQDSCKNNWQAKNVNAFTEQGGFSNGTVWLYPYYPEALGPSGARCIIHAYKLTNQPNAKTERTDRKGLIHC